jgi:hypothetical protein
MSDRAETGPMQFGDDWPGVFIRGDNAMGMAIALEVVLDTTDVGGFAAMELRGLVRTLRGCDARLSPTVQMMKPFSDATSSPPSAAPAPSPSDPAEGGQ